MSGQRMAVVGFGNLMRTDDALGMLALERLRADPQLPSGMHVIEGGTLGLELLYPLRGVTHLLALDAIDVGARPGTLLRFADEAMGDLPIAKSVHLLGFADLIGAMRLTGEAPRTIVALGLQPEKIDWGTELTPVLQRSLPRLIEAALAQLKRWAGECGQLLPEDAVSVRGKPVAAGAV